jgi:hypothetical protein
MADATYTPKTYEKAGGDTIVIASGGSVDVESGGKITADGTQAAALTDITVTGTYASDDTAIQTAVNGILAALRGVGIIAS